MSKTSIKQVTFSIHQTLKKTPLAFATKQDYQHIVCQSMKQLEKGGFILRDIKQLKQKHIVYLVSQWKEQALSTQTIKNRLSAYRYVCDRLKKENVVLDNTAYALPLSKKENIDRAIHHVDLSKISDPYIHQSLWLQQQFGLRREECLKIKPFQADRGTYLSLQGSWTKGGQPRIIPITTDAQRHCLNNVKFLCGKDSLIPKGTSYITQRNHYDRITQQAGLNNLHGLRYGYAQRRYLVLSKQLSGDNGWAYPFAGGPVILTAKQQIIDAHARRMISKELGHSRSHITRIYCG